MCSPKDLRETTMRHFLMTAATTTVFAALLASAPASALESYGPTKVGNGDATSALAVGAHAQSPRVPLLRRSTARPITISNAQRGFAQTRARSDKIESHLHRRHACAETPRRVTRRGPRGGPSASFLLPFSLPSPARREGRERAGMHGGTRFGHNSE